MNTLLGSQKYESLEADSDNHFEGAWGIRFFGCFRSWILALEG